MNTQPLVSIVIPAFTPRFFAMALQSALGQSLDDLEVLVCDDSGSDEIEAIVRSFELPGLPPVRYVRNSERLGFVANLVQGIELASGRFVKVLCDDDRLFPNCLERQAKVLEEHEDVSLVLAQRVLADSENYVLPMRMANARFAFDDTLFKGDDILAVLETHPLNFLGNFSSALMRRDQMLPLLHALTQDGHRFVGLLDCALFICLMRRGQMVMLSDAAVVERLHPQRLSKQIDVAQGIREEWSWLRQMLKARGGESAPASGWVRHVPLSASAETPRVWKELNLVLILSNWQTCMRGRVGSESESYGEFYQEWLGARQFTDIQRRLLPLTVNAWPRQPRIVPVILDPAGDERGVGETLDSLAAQIYSPHGCVVLSSTAATTSSSVIRLALELDWAGQVNRLLEDHVEADWIYILRAGDRLSESALLVLAERIAVLNGLACIYSDEGGWIDGQPVEPVFKPDFNIDLLRSYPYVGRALAFDRAAILQHGGLDAAFGELAPHDLIWRLVESRGPQAIGHVAEVQLQSAFGLAQWLSLDSVIEQNGRVLSAHLDRLGVTHRVNPDGPPLLHRVEYLHEAQPLVSIVIACAHDLQRLQQCVQSIIEVTAYTCYEVLIAAGEEVDPEIAQWLDAMTSVGGGILRVLRLPLTGDSAVLANAAIEHCLGDYLLMLSSELQVVEAGWLGELVQHAQRPEVAIVGGKVLDRHDKVVHAGMVMGAGKVAAPVFAGADAKSRGYLQRLLVVQNWTAVSGDCLMVRKSVLESLGGLDVEQYAAGLCELDLCLKARTDGYLVVWTPHARLRSVARSSAALLLQSRKSEEQAFCERWLPVVSRDPAYNPNLGLGSADFSLEPVLHGSWNPLCARAVPSILCLPINASAVGHYRVAQPFRALEAAGQVIGSIAYESPSIVQLARMDPDAVVLQLRHSAGAVQEIERMTRFSNARRIFEIDDYVLSTPKNNAHARNKAADIEQHLRECIGLCDRLVVSTEALGEALSSMHRDIRVVPNMLAPHLWLGLQSVRGASTKPRVGWGGGTSHGGDLEIIAEVVRALANDVEWVFFGMCPESLRPYIHEFHPVIGLQDYPGKLASLNLDLALAPLEFHIFNDCKSNLRLLEYGACGYPVICSDTRAYQGDLPCTRVVSNSTQEWLQAIRMHLDDPQASYQLGDALREAVLRDYVLRDDNLQHWEWGWLAD